MHSYQHRLMRRCSSLNRVLQRCRHELRRRRTGARLGVLHAERGQLNSPADRLAALLAVIAAETEPIVTLTHLLQLCRDEHVVLWERVTYPDCHDQVAATLSRLGEIYASQVNPTLDKATRLLLATTLNSTTGVPPVVVAHAPFCSSTASTDRTSC